MNTCLNTPVQQTKCKSININKNMNKYNAKKVTYDGIVFDSKKEYNRYLLLKQKEKDGIISKLTVHVPVTIIAKNDKFRKCDYIVDFKYWYESDFIYEDVKPSKYMITDVFKLKQKLMYDKYGIYVNVVLDVNEFE